MLRRLMLGAVAVSAGALGSAPGAVLASPIQDPVPIGPNQMFVGLANGTSSDAVIDIACFGPIHPGQTGHPMAGQTVEVQANFGGPDGGFTGNARRIIARLSFRAPTRMAIPVATFSNYFLAAPISTALTFPCSGSGSVAFRPVHGGSGARPAVVKISFASGD